MILRSTLSINLLFDSHSLRDTHTRGFFRSYLGVDFPLADAETNAAILSSNEVKAMPEYPAQDCMRMIDGVLVIKLGPTR